MGIANASAPIHLGEPHLTLPKPLMPTAELNPPARECKLRADAVLYDSIDSRRMYHLGTILFSPQSLVPSDSDESVMQDCKPRLLEMGDDIRAEVSSTKLELGVLASASLPSHFYPLNHHRNYEGSCDP